MIISLRPSHAGLTILVLLAAAAIAPAQTNPVAQTLPLSQGWGSTTFSTMPAGFAAWNGLNGGSITSQALAEASSPPTDATVTAGNPTATGGCYGYAPSGDGRFAIVESSNATNGVNQLVTAIDTLGQTDIHLSFNYYIVTANTRTLGSVVQYRIGTSGTWTTITGAGNPYIQSGGVAGFQTPVNLPLPAAAENHSIVEIRWALWRGTESGSSSAMAIDGISITGSGGGSGNFPSVYAGPDRTLTISNGSLPIVLTDATVNDADGLTGVTYAWTPATGPNITSWTNRTGSVVDPTSPSEASVTVNATGNYVFTLTATDPESHVNSSNVTITVTQPSQGGVYDPPAGYYDPARPGGNWLTGASLKSALNGIITTGFHSRSYDAAKQALQILDEDPDNHNNLILIYTGISVPKPWDAGNTWNREHQWPDSLNGSGAADSDLFELRPCDPDVNSSRGNVAYGLGIPPTYWDPNQGNPADRGACSRACFYMATRYTNLTLINGSGPNAEEMGDRAQMLVWHYEQQVNTFERRRNHYVYSSVANPGYYQGNRNPFIDHPELVWSVFGGGANNSTLFLGVVPPPDGTTSTNLSFRVVVNAPLPSGTVTLNKAGANPTTFDIIPTGGATCSPSGASQSFIGGAQSRVLTVGIASTSTVANASGSVVLDNTDITSSGTGAGSADGNDVINVSALVLDHSNASWVTPVDTNTTTVDFGTYVSGNGIQTRELAIHNLETTPTLTADLKLNNINGTGSTAALFPTVSLTPNIPAGTNRGITAKIDTVNAGSFSAAYTITVADEAIPGATAGTSLTLNMVGQVVAPGPIVPPDFDVDGDVDEDDVAHFISCAAGADVVVTVPACTNVDVDGDGDGDLQDFAKVQLCYSTKARPTIPTCAD